MTREFFITDGQGRVLYGPYATEIDALMVSFTRKLPEPWGVESSIQLRIRELKNEISVLEGLTGEA